jgi:RecJ-like exonuclease
MKKTKHIKRQKAAKKRGRPKGSKNKPKVNSIVKVKVKKVKKNKENKTGAPAKKRGRPKGSKNKNKKPVVFKAVKKRGRPKGSKNKPRVPDYQDKCWGLGKFLGYCRCGGIIAQKDMNTMQTVICKSCGKKSKISALRQENKVKDDLDTSSKYRESKHHEQIPDVPDEPLEIAANDDDDITIVDPSSIKVRDI